VTAGERGRSVKAGDVATGAGTLEAVRRQLEGKWELTALEVTDASGKAVPVTTTGLLTYDAFGNFELTIRMDPAAASALGTNAALDVNGRAVIDVVNSSLRIQDAVAPAGAPAGANVNRTRYYAFEGDTLTLSTRDAAGKVASTSRWKRQP
jgi:hypothetical protein